MEGIMELLRTDVFLIILLILVIIMIVLYIISLVKLSKIKKEYDKFINKLGNGVNIEEILNNHIDRINKVITKNEELDRYCTELDNDMRNCIQKVGIYKYNAYKDSGNDLSFAVALLNEKNDGVIINGIYSREMSNTFAKPIKNGESTYIISEEEKIALKKAMNP